MRVEIEAAALFITRLVNKNLSQASAGSSASSTHSSASSSYSSSESPPAPGYSAEFQQPDSHHHNQQQQQAAINNNNNNEQLMNHHHDHCVQEDKVEQFRQCLMKALHDRFHNHWFPEKPSKGQAYRCIRLNGWDRHDETLLLACAQCGIDYKDLQLPVELTLWVDPDEVTCRFGENKGSHCLVAKFKDGELQDNNLDLDDIQSINIEFFPQQTTTEKMRQLTLNEAHVDYNTRKHHHNSHQHHQQQQQLNGMSINNNHHNTSIGSIKSNNSPQSMHHHHHHHHHNNNHHHHHQSNNSQPQNHQHQQQTHNMNPHNQYHHNNNHLQQHHQKTAILPNYHNNYINDNPIYYYF